MNNLLILLITLVLAACGVLPIGDSSESEARLAAADATGSTVETPLWLYDGEGTKRHAVYDTPDIASNWKAEEFAFVVIHQAKDADLRVLAEYRIDRTADPALGPVALEATGEYPTGFGYRATDCTGAPVAMAKPIPSAERMTFAQYDAGTDQLFWTTPPTPDGANNVVEGVDPDPDAVVSYFSTFLKQPDGTFICTLTAIDVKNEAEITGTLAAADFIYAAPLTVKE